MFGTRLELGPGLPLGAGGRVPRTVGSRAISHLVRIERERSPRRSVFCRFIGHGVQDVLGLRKPMGPSLFRYQLSLQPSGNPILLVGRKGRYLGKNICERPGHALRIMPSGLPNKPLQPDEAAVGTLGVTSCDRLVGGLAAQRQGVRRIS